MDVGQWWQMLTNNVDQNFVTSIWRRLILKAWLHLASSMERSMASWETRYVIGVSAALIDLITEPCYHLTSISSTYTTLLLISCPSLISLPPGLPFYVNRTTALISTSIHQIPAPAISARSPCRLHRQTWSTLTLIRCAKTLEIMIQPKASLSALRTMSSGSRIGAGL